MKFIKFFTTKPELDRLGTPVPTKNTIPDWYKNAESTFIVDGDSVERAGLKKCIPFVDAMMSGYVLRLPFDLEIDRDELGNLLLSYDKTILGEIIHERPKEIGATIPRPYGFAPNQLTYGGFWGWKTPKGFSVLVTHPFNRVDLPFHTITALMDSDEFFSAGNIPFFIREDFIGVIPAGTPIAQLLPVKRENWVMTTNDRSFIQEAEFRGILARDERYNYKKTMWHRKEYN
jgi:hypothetical protein